MPPVPLPQAVNELPPEQKQARLHQLNLLANVRPGGTTSAYPGAPSLCGEGCLGLGAGSVSFQRSLGGSCPTL